MSEKWPTDIGEQLVVSDGEQLSQVRAGPVIRQMTDALYYPLPFLEGKRNRIEGKRKRNKGDRFMDAYWMI